MDGEEAFRKLKQLYPELEDGVVQEALVNNDYDLKRASDYLGAKYYREDTGIAQESSLWSSLFGSLVGAGEERPGNSGASEWDLTLEGIQEGVANLGVQLVSGVDALADTLGSLGDLIPDLLFGSEDGYYDEDDPRAQRTAEKDQVVVAGSRTTQVVKKRGVAPGANPPPPVAPPPPVDEYDDYEEDEEDWNNKED